MAQQGTHETHLGSLEKALRLDGRRDSYSYLETHLRLQARSKNWILGPSDEVVRSLKSANDNEVREVRSEKLHGTCSTT